MGKALTGFLLVVLAIAAGFSVLLNYLFSPTATMMVWFVLISLFLILVVLIQKPKGGGLSGAFGGAGGGSANDMLGAKAGDVLTWFTIAAFICFLGMSIALTLTMLPADANAAEEAPLTVPADEAETTAADELEGTAGEPIIDEPTERTHPSNVVEPQPITTPDPIAEPVTEPVETTVPATDPEAIDEPAPEDTE